MRLLLEETMAIIVDYQEKLVPVMDKKEELIKSSTILVKGLKELGVPMIVTQQYTKGIGMTVPEITEALGSEAYIDKVSFSCYENEQTRVEIEGLNRKNVIVCGIEAHICVLQTCIDLKEAGYNPILVTDCISSRKPMDKKMALKRADREGIMLTTYEAILFELTRKAGSDVFKVISKLIK